jgi:hypothetical protein
VGGAEIGALLTGLASLISALASLKITQKRMKGECDQRVSEVQRALREGYKLGKGAERPPPDDDPSLAGWGGGSE